MYIKDAGWWSVKGVIDAWEEAGITRLDDVTIQAIQENCDFLKETELLLNSSEDLRQPG